MDAVTFRGSCQWQKKKSSSCDTQYLNPELVQIFTEVNLGYLFFRTRFPDTHVFIIEDQTWCGTEIKNPDTHA